MMDRREFVNFLALTGAGVNALPEQFAAFQRYYDVNVPRTSAPIVSVDEIFVSGLADISTRIAMTFFPGVVEAERTLGINAFGGILRWAASGDQKIVIRKSDLHWSFTLLGGSERPFENVATGHISYVDQNSKRTNLPIQDWRG